MYLVPCFPGLSFPSSPHFFSKENKKDIVPITKIELCLENMEHMGFELPIPLINTLSSAIYARDPHLLYTYKNFFFHRRFITVIFCNPYPACHNLPMQRCNLTIINTAIFLKILFRSFWTQVILLLNLNQNCLQRNI